MVSAIESKTQVKRSISAMGAGCPTRAEKSPPAMRVAASASRAKGRSSARADSIPTSPPISSPTSTGISVTAMRERAA